MLILRKFCTNSGILCKFWSSAQILEFCANSVQFLEFSNTRIFHPTGFHDRISSNFLIISFTISGLGILGGKIPDQRVTEKCRKNCTEWQNFCQCSQTITFLPREKHRIGLSPLLFFHKRSFTSVFFHSQNYYFNAPDGSRGQNVKSKFFFIYGGKNTKSLMDVK